MISAVTSVVGMNWLMIEFRPNVASTAEKARSTGMPAATAAPNANSRMTSVSGSETFLAWFRSPSILLERTWSADACPNSAMCISGCAFWSPATAFMTGWIRSLAVSDIARDVELHERRSAVLGHLAGVARRPAGCGRW